MLVIHSNGNTSSATVSHRPGTRRPNQSHREHVRKDHNPFISCHTCWRTFPTNDDATKHREMGGCATKVQPYPEGFWITADILEKLNPPKKGGSMWKGNSTENWYTLFDMLRPKMVERIGKKEIRSQFHPCRWQHTDHEAHPPVAGLICEQGMVIVLPPLRRPRI